MVSTDLICPFVKQVIRDYSRTSYSRTNYSRLIFTGYFNSLGTNLVFRALFTKLAYCHIFLRLLLPLSIKTPM